MSRVFSLKCITTRPLRVQGPLFNTNTVCGTVGSQVMSHNTIMLHNVESNVSPKTKVTFFSGYLPYNSVVK